MEKKIEDYLHLYLGCKVNFGFGEWLLIGVHNHYAVLDGAQFGSGLIKVTEFHIIKPILRPLNDMTEDEKKELYHLDDHALRELGDGTGYALPYVFTWCLSKQFDLFGLIEAGLAIDATKITTP